MAREARGRIIWDPLQGAWRLLYRKSPAELAVASVDHTFGDADRLRGDVVLAPTTDADLITKVNLRFARDWTLGSGSGLEAYASVVEGTGGTGSKTADEKYACDFIRRSDLAQEVADFYAAWDTVSTRTIAINLLAKHLHVDVGDVVALSLPIPGSDPVQYLGGIEAARFVVLAVGFSPLDANSQSPPYVPVLLQEVPA